MQWNSDHLQNHFRFQSLFWWKSEIKYSWLLAARSWSFRSFNPCFGGNQKSNGYRPDPQEMEKIQFQSLFWWKSEIKWKERPVVALRWVSFNPCFGGNQKSNFPLLCNLHQPVFIVSILVLVEIRNQISLRFTDHQSIFLFQSLFWWKSEIK